MAIRALIATLLLGFSFTAAAQSSLSNSLYRYPSLSVPTYSTPSSSTTYDWRSGNRYTTQRNYDGSTNVRGSNLYTGSQWRTTVQPNGDMRGVDKDGNYWRYSNSTKIYTNLGTGTTCMGQGALRTCF